MSKSDRYRRGVGVMLINRDGKVWVGARIDNPDDAWQMPQGGIDEGEEPWATALRESRKKPELCLISSSASPNAPSASAMSCPRNWRARLWGGKWVGQDQDWFLARFLGQDSDVNIATEHPEFREWKWVEPAVLPELIVPFKRDLYRRLIAEFGGYL